jgi:8-oxo-dGTP pyrophosphatase MutT (NUDIX family)
MKIDIFADNITRKDVFDVPHRTACRGIIKRDNQYLVVRLKKHDITTFPGGGLEQGETLEACVKREVLEETGVSCKVREKTIEINEYFQDSKWTNVYFICEYVEQTHPQTLTDEEKRLELVVEWQSLDELLDRFQNNMTQHAHGPNIHNREFLGLIHSIKGE